MGKEKDRIQNKRPQAEDDDGGSLQNRACFGFILQKIPTAWG